MGIVVDSLDDFVLLASCAMSLCLCGWVKLIFPVLKVLSLCHKLDVLGPDGRTFNGWSVLGLLLCTVWASGGGSG